MAKDVFVNHMGYIMELGKMELQMAKAILKILEALSTNNFIKMENVLVVSPFPQNDRPTY